jgi:hypothetical protein
MLPLTINFSSERNILLLSVIYERPIQNLEIVGSISEKLITFLQLISLQLWGLVNHFSGMGTRNLHRGKALPLREADILTAISDLSRRCGSLNLSQLYGAFRPVNGSFYLYFYRRMTFFSVV